ncbi:U4/U6 small nuclear ribonucleoprotein [Haematococcus lacustris]|uniref:U4/U6 small nuclear ribonucleoprotein n=1 Tax=Haematococcus lacustris TaxID=44745 RepID=A0A6A0AMR4_HAELA|nr:U4/U6 small nuclear ribonucleoprotein [Haematococcus lacustris]
MAQTLAESFLADLDELSDDEPIDDEDVAEANDASGGGGDDLDDIEALNYDDLSAVAKLNSAGMYQDIMQRVRAALEAASTEMEEQRARVSLEDDPTYKLAAASGAAPLSLMVPAFRPGGLAAVQLLLTGLL